IVQLPGNGALTIAFLAALWPVVQRWRAKQEAGTSDRDQFAIALVIALLLAGSYAASPVFKQYLYAPMPLMVLGLIWSFRKEDSPHEIVLRQRWVVAVATVSCAFGIHHYLSTPLLFTPSAWTPMQVEARAL